MKKIFLILCGVISVSRCTTAQKTNTATPRDGFYEVMGLVNDTANFVEPGPNQVLLSFDTLFNPGDFTRVLVDTLDYIPLELDEPPLMEQQSENQKLLSVSFTPESAGKMKTFTSSRIMKEVVIVLDGKAITMHKIRDTITGDKMQITRCGDNACEYLYVKMKYSVKH